MAENKDNTQTALPENTEVLMLFKFMGNKIDEFEVETPTADELALDLEHVVIPLPDHIKEEKQYIFGSYAEAAAAAVTAIDKMMYSKRLDLLRNIIADYSTETLRPYICCEKSENNFYYKANRKARQLLDELVSEYRRLFPDRTISEEFFDIPFCPPEAGWHLEMLSKGILDMAEVIFRESDLEADSLGYFANDYFFKIGENVEEKGGKKYCFTVERIAFEVIAMDIKDACEEYFHDYIVEGIVLGCVKVIVKRYVQELRNELYGKVYQMMGAVYSSECLK